MAPMHCDIVDLRDFYATSLGLVARRMIRAAVRDIWPETRGLSVLGIGYAAPFLRPFLDDAERVLAMMPPDQGVLHWPPDAANCAFLSDKAELPLADVSVDRVLVVHSLEHSQPVRPLLREIWRIMAGNGRALFVVPNRRGIWARVDNSPFGSGYPFSVSQLSRILRDNMFTPTVSRYALYLPPTRSRTLLAAAGAWENIGRRWFPAFAGVTLVEASKQLYAATPEPAKRRIVIPARAQARPLPATPRTRGERG